MRNEDLLIIYSYAKALWKNFTLPENSEIDIQIHDKLWLEMLSDFEPNIIKAAMIEYSKEHEWCSIGGILKTCEHIQKLANNEIIDEDKILDEIKKAIRRFKNTPRSYLNFAEDDKFNSDLINGLSPTAKKVVVSKYNLREWQNCNNELVLESNLRKAISRQVENCDNEHILQRHRLSSATKPLLENREGKKQN